MLWDDSAEWELLFANSADEAFELASTKVIDTIVSDVTMPGKDGLELLAELKDCPATSAIPVIILTGSAEADLKRKALNLGAADLLNKPVEREDLIARLGSVLRLKRYEDALRAHNELLEYRVRERTLELESSRRDIIWRLAKAGEFRDEDTGDHVVRVALSSRILAAQVGLPQEMVESIFLTSPLHDIGKIGIPDGILLKPGKLSVEEREQVQKHCEIGASILLEMPKGAEYFLSSAEAPDQKPNLEAIEPIREQAATIAMTHHERWDGNGYPNRLRGEDIPIVGRIVAVADLYDALRSSRPYKEAFSVEKATGIMEESVGNHIDPEIYEAFTRVQEELEEIRSVKFR
jgi:response regulator RpfG family c-di-GMP phosphodiesterase